MDKYELDWLEEKFTDHALSAENQRLEMIDRWKNEYSSDKIPEHMQDIFNLPKALLSLVKEIRSLRMLLQDAQLCLSLNQSATYLEPEQGSTEANT